MTISKSPIPNETVPIFLPRFFCHQIPLPAIPLTSLKNLQKELASPIITWDIDQCRIAL
jgi:hypothetical protein